MFEPVLWYFFLYFCKMLDFSLSNYYFIRVLYYFLKILRNSSLFVGYLREFYTFKPILWGVDFHNKAPSNFFWGALATPHPRRPPCILYTQHIAANRCLAKFPFRLQRESKWAKLTIYAIFSVF